MINLIINTMQRVFSSRFSTTVGISQMKIFCGFNFSYIWEMSALILFAISSGDLLVSLRMLLVPSCIMMVFNCAKFVFCSIVMFSSVVEPEYGIISISSCSSFWFTLATILEPGIKFVVVLLYD